VIEFKNIGQVESQLHKWGEEAKALVTGVARGLSVVAFKYAVEISPQYSGDFAANWKYSAGFIDDSFLPDVVSPSNKYPGKYQDLQANTAFSQGDFPARNAALRTNAGRELEFILGSTIYISNNAAHDEPYALLIEENKIKFRPENAQYQGFTVGQTLEHLKDRYANINGSDAVKLSAMRIV